MNASDVDLRSRSARPRLVFVDALRGLAAVTVFTVHSVGVVNTAAVAHPGGVAAAMVAAGRFGPLGVDVFFVISGFVIAYSIRTDRVTPGYAARFALRRSIRLDPPYWCAIVVAIAWAVVRHRLGNAPEPVPTAAQVASHLLYLQGILGRPNVLVIFWTLCLEVQLYLAFIALLMVARWLPRWVRADGGYAGASAAAWTLVASMLWPAGVFGHGRTTAEGFPAWFPPTAFEFLAGTCVAYVVMGQLRAAHVAGLLGLLAGAVGVDAVRRTGATYPGPFPAVVAVAAATSLLVAAQVGGLTTWLRWRPLLFAGAVSYSFYLLHIPVIDVVLAVQTRRGATGTAASLTLWAVTLVGAFAAAWVLYRAVERPSMRLAARFKERRDGPAVPPPDVAVTALP